MNRKHVPVGSLLAVLLIAVAPRLQGQAAPATGAKTTPEEETVVLSPFVVDASEDADTYRAEATLAGTRIRTELRDVGSAIQVITKKFLEDTGATSSQDLLVYTTSTEVGGQGGNFVGAGNGATIDTTNQRNSPQSNTRVRGLTNADNTRDFFLTDIPWDSYNVGRVDLSRGANSILFGIGSPAGVVNSSLNTASFADSNNVEFRFGSFGTTRTSADFNKVILENQLAFRISALNDETKYRQDPAFSHDKRIFGAVRFDPKFLNKNGITTQIRANYEDGSIVANRPRIIPPQDGITPWFRTGTYQPTAGRTVSNLNKRTYNATLNGTPSILLQQTDPHAGPNWSNLSDPGNPNNPTYNPWVGRISGGIFDEPVAVFADENYGLPSGVFEASRPGAAYPTLVVPNWATYNGIVTYVEWARRTDLPGRSIGAIKNITLTDPNIYDFYNQLIDGPNKREKQNFRSYNLALSQTYWDGKFGFEASYADETTSNENTRILSADVITVDIQHILPNGSPNPNVGRPLTIGSSSGNRNGGGTNDRDAFRLTAFTELNFKDMMNESTIGNILGRHVITGLYSSQRHRNFGKSWYTYDTDLLWRPGIGTSPAVTNIDSRRISTIHYLGDALWNLSSASEAHINNIKTYQTIPSQVTLRRYNQALRTGVTTPLTIADIVGYDNYQLGVVNGRDNLDRDALTGSATEILDNTESKALVWQGFFWDGTIVPTVGYRKDSQKHFTAGDVKKDPRTGQALYRDPTFVLGDLPTNEESGSSTSYSVVVHTPKALRDKLPFDLSVFYNKADNFQPQAGRVDIFNQAIASPVGETKDYGVTIGILEDKVTLKINKYETSVVNASLDGGSTGVLSSTYRLGANEAWGYTFGSWSLNRIPGSGYSNNWGLVDPALPFNATTNPRIDPTVDFLGYQPLPGQSVRAAYDAWQATLADFFDPANAPEERFVQAWQLNARGPVAGRPQFDPTLGWSGPLVNSSQPAGLTVVGDTFSKGTEYELSAQPVRNWNISINAAKTDAIRDNLASSFSEWVDARNEFYQGPAGDLRMWNSGNDQQTLKSVWNSEFYASYQLYLVQQGASVPELRPWRFNAITNYDFSTGRLKGINLGGAIRWQDRIVIGYPVLADPDGTGPLLESFDITRPFKGKSESTADVWVGYRKRLFDSIDWRLQLNVRNIFASKDLVPVTVQPDGSPATSRIPEPRVWTITNSFKF